ncbi:putative bifunctional diguanylate cyclase/phosphodiesterase [Deinococcus aquiradiocola]|uniref:Uncharacterized protein n=1 Tax=Deinococcus aquiradiocola TaxID=393059 RepID=A0A917PFD0_9DEIO|nr:bifunctional diguanylate cyclase/phosphodiesterase [Deinococcus aquiradiocola]GGJ74731.1 hypothetical protein GCM10008939_18820 [Deinococcus aquiradiocola]
MPKAVLLKLYAAHPSTTGRHARPVLRGPLALLLALTALPLSWLALHWGPATWQPVLGDLAYVPLYLAAALLCLQRAERSSGRVCTAWMWVAASPFAFALGSLSWAYTELVLHGTPFPSAADLFYPLQQLTLGVGLLLFPRTPLSRADLSKRRLDVGVMLSGLLTLVWFGVGPRLLHDWAGQPLAMLVSMSYPTLDIWLLTVVLWNAMHHHAYRTDGRGGRRLRLGADALIVVSVSCSVIADLGFALDFSSIGLAGGSVYDWFWTLSPLFLGLAALIGRPRPELPLSPDTGPHAALTVLRPTSPLSRAVGTLGPYVALGSCFLVLAVSLRGQQALWLLAGTTVVTVLAAARQIVGQLENEQFSLRLSILSRDLESRVQSRTAELEAAGQVLRQLTGELDARVMERTAQLEASQALLAYQTRHDALTGVPTRSLFEEQLRDLLAAPGVGLTAVLYVNLDGFKSINDRFGHGQGDELLRELARRLQALLRRSDTPARPGALIGRCGGDEFVLAFPGLASAPHAESCARRVAGIASSIFLLNNQPVTLAAGIGISLAPTDGTDASELIRQADIAMSQAKASGRNGLCFYDPQMNRVAQERGQLEQRLRLALERVTASGVDPEGVSGLNLWYQPQYDLTQDTGSHLPVHAPCSFEALIRWNDPQLGPVSPVVFIPVAEDSGLIVALGQWVLRQTCAQLRRWPGTKIAINVAAAQFDRPEFVDDVRTALQDFGLSGERLELELTERQVISDLDGMVRKMHELRALGVQISLDDFGVGQSALGHLLKLPVSVLKVDRMFVQSLHDVSGAPRVLQAIVALAHSLGIRVVAEGVETCEQLGTVRDLGCDLVQGYLTGRPMNPRDAAVLLARPAPTPSTTQAATLPTPGTR